MNKISTKDTPGSSKRAIVRCVYVYSQELAHPFGLTYSGLATLQEAESAALRCAAEAAPAVLVRDAAGIIADILSGQYDVNGLLKIAADPVWEETGITVDIYYDETKGEQP